MTKKKKVLLLIAIYILITGTFFACDQLLLDGVFSRDFMQNFVYEGMDPYAALRLVGKPLRDVGSGLPVMEYTLPFGKHLYLTIEGEAISKHSDDYFLKGTLIPVIMAAVAGLEAACYFCFKKRRKTNDI